MHWASLEQGLVQAAAAQVYGLQSTPVALVTQPPMPLQICPDTLFPVQVVTPQAVPTGYSRQAPPPSQVPSFKQLVGASAEHSSCGSLPPATGPHSPSLP
jgi:hypothetical protein